MPDHAITTLDTLVALYPNPVAPASIAKEIDHVDANYAALIAASPFFVLATNGPDGLDCSPRGDQAGLRHRPGRENASDSGPKRQ